MRLRRLLPSRDKARTVAARRAAGAAVATVLAAAVIVPAASPRPVAAGEPVALVAKHQQAKAAKAARSTKAARHKKVKQRKRAVRMLSLVNSARARGRSCGGTYYPKARSLRYNAKLSDAARKFAKDLGRHRYFSHAGRSGSSPTSRANAEGYRGLVGENIAAGRSGVRATMRDWLASPGHCANIMSTRYRHLGIGYANVPGSPYRTYWVQDFGFR